MRVFKMNKDNWICGVSNGLVLPCAVCGKTHIRWNYTVKDKLWNKIVPENLKRDVICLPCLEKLAKKHKENIAENIIEVQYTGNDFTVEFLPSNVFYYNKKENK